MSQILHGTLSWSTLSMSGNHVRILSSQVQGPAGGREGGCGNPNSGCLFQMHPSSEKQLGTLDLQHKNTSVCTGEGECILVVTDAASQASQDSIVRGTQRQVVTEL